MGRNISCITCTNSRKLLLTFFCLLVLILLSANSTLAKYSSCGPSSSSLPPSSSYSAFFSQENENSVAYAPRDHTMHRSRMRYLLQAIRKELDCEVFYVRKSLKPFHSNHWFHIGEYFTSYFGIWSKHSKISSPTKILNSTYNDELYKKNYLNNLSMSNSSSNYNSISHGHPLYSSHKSRVDLKANSENKKIQNLYIIIEKGNPKFKFSDHMTSMTLFLTALGFSGDNVVFKKFGVIDIERKVVHSMETTGNIPEFNLKFSVELLNDCAFELISDYISEVNSYRNENGNENGNVALPGTFSSSSSSSSSRSRSSSSSSSTSSSRGLEQQENDNGVGKESLFEIGYVPKVTSSWFAPLSMNSSNNSNKKPNRNDKPENSKLKPFAQALSYYCPIMSIQDLIALNGMKYIAISQCISKSCYEYTQNLYVSRPASLQENGFPLLITTKKNKIYESTSSNVNNDNQNKIHDINIGKGNQETTRILDRHQSSNRNAPTLTIINPSKSKRSLRSNTLASTTSTTSTVQTVQKIKTKLNLVILERDSTRQIKNFRFVISSLRNILSPQDWDVFIIFHREWVQPCALVNVIRNADFFLTTHGFQCMSSIFMNPGSAMLEIFPFRYFKDSYVQLASKFGVSHNFVRNNEPTSWNRYALKYISEEACMNHAKCRSHARNDQVYVSQPNMDKILLSLHIFQVEKSLAREKSLEE